LWWWLEPEEQQRQRAMADSRHVFKAEPSGFPCFTLFTKSNFPWIWKLTVKAIKNKTIKIIRRKCNSRHGRLLNIPKFRSPKQ
jgi:hypothetical protein